MTRHDGPPVPPGADSAGVGESCRRASAAAAADAARLEAVKVGVEVVAEPGLGCRDRVGGDEPAAHQDRHRQAGDPVGELGQLGGVAAESHGPQLGVEPAGVGDRARRYRMQRVVGEVGEAVFGGGEGEQHLARRPGVGLVVVAGPQVGHAHRAGPLPRRQDADVAVPPGAQVGRLPRLAGQHGQAGQQGGVGHGLTLVGLGERADGAAQVVAAGAVAGQQPGVHQRVEQVIHGGQRLAERASEPGCGALALGHRGHQVQQARRPGHRGHPGWRGLPPGLPGFHIVKDLFTFRTINRSPGRVNPPSRPGARGRPRFRRCCLVAGLPGDRDGALPRRERGQLGERAVGEDPVPGAARGLSIAGGAVAQLADERRAVGA